jgi:hypothetical protein
VQQRYRSIEAIFRESFEHMENEAAWATRCGVTGLTGAWGLLVTVYSTMILYDF